MNDGVTEKFVQPEKGIHAFWNRDNPDPVDTGEEPTANDYSTHPFFAYTATDGEVYGVFSNVANAQSWYLNNNETRDYQMVSRSATGGAGTLIFIYPTDGQPEHGYENVVKYGYHFIIGKPVLIPRWSLGWH